MATNTDLTAKELRELVKTKDERIAKLEKELKEALRHNENLRRDVDQLRDLMDAGVYLSGPPKSPRTKSSAPAGGAIVATGRARGQGISAEPSKHDPGGKTPLKKYPKEQT